MRCRSLLLMLSAVLGASFAASSPVAGAALHPAPGTAFPVALNDGAFTANSPRLAADGQGNYVAAWTRMKREGYRYGIVARLFDPLGQPRGPILEVNRRGIGQAPAVGMNERGDFVVAWMSSNPEEANRYWIRAQRFAPDGAKAGPELEVSSAPIQSWTLLGVGIDREGGFAVTWWGQSVLVRRFDRQGAPLGPELSTAGLGHPSAINSSLAMQPDGSFTLIWRSYDAVSTGRIMGLRFDANGRPKGKEFQINEAPLLGTQQLIGGSTAVAAMPDGGLFVVWDRVDFSKHPGPWCDVRARRFDAADRPLSAELAVSPNDGRAHLNPAVAADVYDFAVVSWSDCLSWGINCRVSSRLYDRASAPASDFVPFAVDLDLRSPSTAAGRTGFLVMATASTCAQAEPDCGNTSQEGIFGERIDLPQP
jgi:hypothetical protein